MKVAGITFALSALASSASAHYIWEYFNGGAAYQNIRQNTDYNSPVTDLTSNDLRCNVGATGTGTTTATVAAGSTVTWKLDTPVYHQGPVSFYMSKAPTTAAAYDGSGDWFNIKNIGPVFTNGNADWTQTQQGSFTVQIPSCIAAGDYLLRPQQLAIHNPGGVPQFYTECAQITVTGGGSKAPSPTAKIPGYIKGNEPGYTVNIYNNFTNYTVPGPTVFTC
ncbi:hypothetical protein MMC10_009033 [Thelotrema lepadinum]|nr:hypothetical protein [Thelotrema lepadinum]